ncbi:DUF3592 domain-containing protein [Spirillospora sp. NPDC049652]
MPNFLVFIASVMLFAAWLFPSIVLVDKIRTSNWPLVDGVVVGNNEGRAEVNGSFETVYWMVVAYVTQDGVKVTASNSVSQGGPSDIGKRVTLRYNPRRPDKFRLGGPEKCGRLIAQSVTSIIFAPIPITLLVYTIQRIPNPL